MHGGINANQLSVYHVGILEQSVDVGTLYCNIMVKTILTALPTRNYYYYKIYYISDRTELIR